MEQHSPGLIIAGASSQGREVCSRLAARLGTPLAQDVIDWESEDSGFFVSRPMYGGRVVARLALRGEPGIISIRPNVFPEPEPGKVREGSIETLNLDPAQSRLKVLDKVRQQNRAEIAEAEVIVAGGYAAGEEGFQALETLAEKLHGAVGASRSAVDAGWRPVQDQVGQTGKVVSPKLYLACGISGAIQHVTGIATAKTVVAINKNPQAPIFAKADLGVVGDLHEIVPFLTKKLEERAEGRGRMDDWTVGRVDGWTEEELIARGRMDGWTGGCKKKAWKSDRTYRLNFLFLVSGQVYDQTRVSVQALII